MYDLRLTSEVFWRLTPRQFHLLWDRHHERVVHQEMLQAWTTAAVINFGFYAPEEPIAESRFMPNFRPQREEPSGPPIPEDVMAEYHSRVANTAALLEQYQATGKADPQLVAMGLVRADG